MSDTDATSVRHNVAAEVDEIIEHVINANMLSMPYDVYSEIFDAVDGLGVAMEKMQAENDKLRELVNKAWHCVNRPFSCYECRVAAGGCTLLSTMREMGIGVDE